MKWPPKETGAMLPAPISKKLGLREEFTAIFRSNRIYLAAMATRGPEVVQSFLDNGQ